ncbi:HAMP domain-containing protein [Peribacillus saganii]|uniref:HAMP domain-containing protein n=1 Tax=Peribacillus saganii TaxID=2303992 RepID=A0A372LQR5_9BACI|nr:histidine kinase [Peribacillus saganii]RFU70569.1 HAMP domain-containing protein [Peribacillus saganii]
MFISIKYKYIILYSILTIIPILVVDTIAYQFLVQKLRTNIIESNQEIVTQANNMLTLFKDTEIDTEGSKEQRKMIYYSLANSVIGQGSEIILSDRKGKVIYSTNSHMAGKKLHAKAIDSKAGSGNYLASYLQVERLAIYSFNPMTEWYLVVFTPTDNIFKKIEYVEKLMVALITVSIILVVFLIFVLSNHLTSPIHKLTRTMQKIEIGNFDIEIQKKVFIKDEIWQITLSFNKIVEKLKSHMHYEYLFRIKTNEAKFLALQSQINPHFLYNTLETINSIARVEKVPIISELSMSLSKMFRYNSNMDNKYVHIRDEINHVENYLNVQLIRFNGNIQKQSDYDPEIMDCKMVKLSLQPIIENCFVHAFQNMASNGIIFIRAARKDGNAVIEVKDNGRGMDAEKLTEINNAMASWDWSLEEGELKKQKIGIYNVNSRIRMAFGEKFGLQLRPNVPSGLSVIVTLPFIKEEGNSNV